VAVQNDWEQNRAQALRLSETIVGGMRYVKSNLLLSDIWFKDLDITLASREGVILDGTVTAFQLSQAPPVSVFAQWRVFRNIDFELELMSTISCTTAVPPGARTRMLLSAVTDSLFLDVYQSSDEIRLRPDANPTVKLTFWRDKKKNDKIIVLEMDTTKYGDVHVHEAALP